MNEAAQSAAADFARRTVPFWLQALGAELIGIYLLGSLAHGGFSARYSDVDIAVITESGVTQPVLDRARAEAIALSPEWGPRLSVFWTDRAFAVGRFPPLDRVDYLDHAVALIERERVRPPRPSIADIRSYLAGAPFAGWAEHARRFASAGSFEPQDRKPYLRALLYPGRFCFSFMTGRMGSNDEAVEFLARSMPAGLDVGSIARALEIRRANADPDPLFSERAVLVSHIEACAALIGAAARPSQRDDS